MNNNYTDQSLASSQVEAENGLDHEALSAAAQARVDQFLEGISTQDHMGENGRYDVSSARFYQYHLGELISDLQSLSGEETGSLVELAGGKEAISNSLAKIGYSEDVQKGTLAFLNNPANPKAWENIAMAAKPFPKGYTDAEHCGEAITHAQECKLRYCSLEQLETEGEHELIAAIYPEEKFKASILKHC